METFSCCQAGVEYSGLKSDLDDCVECIENQGQFCTDRGEGTGVLEKIEVLEKWLKRSEMVSGVA